MTDDAAVAQKLIDILQAYAGEGAALTAATNFMADLMLESVRVLEFIVEVEDAFDVVIDIESLSDVHTVAELAAVVARIKSD